MNEELTEGKIVNILTNTVKVIKNVGNTDCVATKTCGPVNF